MAHVMFDGTTNGIVFEQGSDTPCPMEPGTNYSVKTTLTCTSYDGPLHSNNSWLFIEVDECQVKILASHVAGCPVQTFADPKR